MFFENRINHSCRDFGKIKSSSGTVINRYTYTAREYDSETSLYYYRNRAYDSIIGRFIQKDPIGFYDGPNIYSYVQNNPINYKDLMGLARIYWFGYGRNPLIDGPRYGNWGGGKWSGGWNPDYHDGKMGNAPYEDSLDFCCQKHDFCWYKCERKFPCKKDKEKQEECIRKCNRELIDCLSKLDENPENWPEPPSFGTKEDAKTYKTMAEMYFHNKT